MDENEARGRVTAARVGRLGTVTPDARPHLVPVVFAVVGGVLYTAVDSKPKTTTALQRLANVEASGRASVLVDHYSDDWSELWWVRVDGPAQVLRPGRADPPAGASQSGHDEVRTAVGALTAKYPHYYVSQPPTGPVIRMALEQWRWWEATTTSDC